MATEGKVSAQGGVSTVTNAPDAGSLDSGGDLSVRATLQDGEVRVTLTATVPYGNRTVSVTRDTDAPDELITMLQEIADADGDTVLRDGRREAARSMLVAMDKGEEV